MQQRLLLPSGSTASRHASSRHAPCHPTSRPTRHAACRSSNNGAASAPKHCAFVPYCPSPAETARTIVDLCCEASLATLSPEGIPIASPVQYSLDKEGQPLLQLAPGSMELFHLARSPQCSLLIYPTTYPTRAVASVTLVGTLKVQALDPQP